MSSTVNGKYEILERLAVGGMGEVSLAREHGLHGFNRLVVLKQLLPQSAEDPDAIQLFIDEARICAHLSHPNIVQVLDFGEARGNYFLALEYVPGLSVDRIWTRLHAKGLPRIGLYRGIHIVAQVLRALDYAHGATDSEGHPLSIIHRDVSPQNVLVSQKGDVKLADFGIARASNKRTRTRSGMVYGKEAYMAPEQRRGDKDLTPRVDVFSAGALLWELVIGRRLFARGDDTPVVRVTATEAAPRPRSIDPSLPRELDDIIMAALEHDPEKRIPSAAAFATALRQFADREGMTVHAEELGELVQSVLSADEKKRFTSAAIAIDPALAPTGTLEPDVAAQAGTSIEPPNGKASQRNRFASVGGAVLLLTLIAAPFLIPKRGEKSPTAAPTPTATPTPTPSVSADPSTIPSPALPGSPAPTVSPSPSVRPAKAKRKTPVASPKKTPASPLPLDP